jgi:hypothetical protein
VKADGKGKGSSVTKTGSEGEAETHAKRNVGYRVAIGLRIHAWWVEHVSLDSCWLHMARAGWWFRHQLLSCGRGYSWWDALATCGAAACMWASMGKEGNLPLTGLLQQECSPHCLQTPLQFLSCTAWLLTDTSSHASGCVQLTPEEMAERNQRTVFVGNVLANTSRKTLKKLFEKWVSRLSTVAHRAKYSSVSGLEHAYLLPCWLH